MSPDNTSDGWLKKKSLTMQEDYPYSVCEDFINPDTELVTAWYIMQTRPKPNHVSVL